MTSANASARRAGSTAEHGAQRAANSKTLEWLTRFGFVCYGVLHLLLAYLVVQIAFGGGSQEGDQSGAFKKVAQQHATQGVMAKPAGVWLVALAGVVVLAVGAGMAWYGLKRKFESKLHTERMSVRARKAARRLGQIGYAGKGAAFAIVGVLLIDAAVTHNPSESRGLDAAFRTVAGQPFGVAGLIVIAIGFLAYGLFCFFQSRYRKVGT